MDDYLISVKLLCFLVLNFSTQGGRAYQKIKLRRLVNFLAIKMTAGNTGRK